MATERSDFVPAAEHAAASDTLAKSRSYLLSLQSPEGWWKGDLETNVTMDAEDLMLREFLGNRDADDTAAAARWIRSQQREDGTWANYYGGPGDLSTTAEAYVALRIAGDSPQDPHMEIASRFVRERGGIEATRVFTRVWLALFGLWAWDDLPAMPPEVILLPPRLPLSVYDFGCWARQTVVALTVVAAYRPVRPLGFGVEELRTGVMPRRPGPSLFDWKGRFTLLDLVLRGYERLAAYRPVRATVREVALAAAERWIVRRQEADGSWGGIQPPWVYSVLALHLRGYSLDHPVIANAFEGLERFTIRRDEVRWLEACQSPVWDTALATIALSDAGIAPDDERLVRAATWLLGEEVKVRGDWSVRRPGVPTGGWSFEFANDSYPDVDDTAEVVMALRRVAHPDTTAVDAAAARGVAWIEGMASRDGAWGAFDADNMREILYELPFSDFGAVIDPPSADVTAHALEMLADERNVDPASIERGVAWLRAAQEYDGAWYGRWGVNYVYGTGAAVPALVAAGVAPDDLVIRRAVAFLEVHQNDDGGWGEDIRSYDDPTLRGEGISTASQTAWALLALVSAGEATSAAARRGVEFLGATQRPDGNWDEPWYTGTGFPGDFYINYHLYRLCFPVTALGRWLRAVRPGGAAPEVSSTLSKRESAHGGQVPSARLDMTAASESDGDDLTRADEHPTSRAGRRTMSGRVRGVRRRRFARPFEAGS
ncbi:MAG: shc1 [Acidimicrobiaceae bacterium]|jgi:squalene-hopene/tetraprenyl-beta-curcumene cyclase|nr:shc1 [Acidimicrobiaceae bacterium]